MFYFSNRDVDIEGFFASDPVCQSTQGCGNIVFESEVQGEPEKIEAATKMITSTGGPSRIIG